MIVQIDIKDYYKAFIDNANSDIEKYKEELETNKKILADTKTYIAKWAKYIKLRFNIDLDKDFVNSWSKEQYDANEHLTDIIKLCLDDTEGEDRIILLQLLRYSEVLKSCYNCTRGIELAQKRTSITHNQYKEYLRKYYMQGVHKAILEGYAYRFGYGTGDLLINFWKYKTEVRKTIVDWAATKKRKQEILDAGLKLYNKDEAAIYELRGLKYDGVPYVVYKTNKEYYDIELVNNKHFRTKNAIKFKHSNYIPAKFRNKSVEELANMFVSLDEIAVQDLGIRHKLVVSLQKDPTIYLKYIRNAEQYRQRRGEHTTKNNKKVEI